MRQRGIGIVRFIPFSEDWYRKWNLALKIKILRTTSFNLIYSLPWFLLLINIIPRLRILASSSLGKHHATSKIESFWSKYSQRKKLCFIVLSDKNKRIRCKLCFYRFGLSPEALDLAQQ